MYYINITIVYPDGLQHVMDTKPMEDFDEVIPLFKAYESILDSMECCEKVKSYELQLRTIPSCFR